MALGLITVFMTLLGWSSVPLFIAYFSQSIDIWTSNGWRYGFSALLWAPVLVTALLGRGTPPGLWRAALLPAVFNALGQVAFTAAFYSIDPATATFGLRVQIVFVAVGAYLLFPSEREVLRQPASWAGIGMVLLGVIGTIAFRDPSHEVVRSVTGRAPPWIGVLLAVSSGLFFAAYGLAVRRCTHGFHPVTAFAAISQYTAAAMLVLMLIFARDTRTGAPDFGAGAWALPAGQFWLLLLSAVVGIALGHVFYYIAIARLGVAVSSGVIQLQPFLVAVAQYYLFNQLLTGRQLLSGVLAVCGALTLLGVQWSTGRKAAAAAHPVVVPPPLPDHARHR